jgi:hypothetical protein
MNNKYQSFFLVCTLKSFLQFGQQWLYLVNHPSTHLAWKVWPQVNVHIILLQLLSSKLSFYSSLDFYSFYISAKHIEHVLSYNIWIFLSYIQILCIAKSVSSRPFCYLLGSSASSSYSSSSRLPICLSNSYRLFTRPSVYLWN